MPAIGEWNHFELAVGKRGFGKSTLLLERLIDLDELAGGAYKIGHSMGQRFPASLPSGRHIQIHYHRDMDSLIRWLRMRPNEFHVLTSRSADEVLQYAQSLGQAIEKQALGFWNRDKSPIGLRATPVIVVIDEMVALAAARGSAQGNDAGKWYRELIISLRHDHVALLAGIQDANSISYVNTGLSTKIHCFRVTHEWAIQALRASNVHYKERLERLPNLGVGEHVTIDG